MLSLNFMFWKLIRKIVKKAVVIFLTSEVWMCNSGTGQCACVLWLSANWSSIYNALPNVTAMNGLQQPCYCLLSKAISTALAFPKWMSKYCTLQSNHSLTSFDLYVSVFTGPAGLEGFLKFFSFLKGNKVLCRILPVDLVCSLLSNPKDLYSFSSKARFFHHSPKLLSLKHWKQ